MACMEIMFIAARVYLVKNKLGIFRSAHSAHSASRTAE